MAYDPQGNVVRRTDPIGKVTQNRPAGQCDAICHDGEDHITETTDPLGNKSITGHDEVGRVISETNPTGETVGYTYDAAGNQTEVFDPTGKRVNKTTYDERNLPLATEDAEGPRHHHNL